MSYGQQKVLQLLASCVAVVCDPKGVKVQQSKLFLVIECNLYASYPAKWLTKLGGRRHK